MEVSIPRGFLGAVMLVNLSMQMIKNLPRVKEYEIERLYPLMALVLGVIFGTMEGLPLKEGLFVGFSAMGTYKFTSKTVLGRKKQEHRTISVKLRR